MGTVWTLNTVSYATVSRILERATVRCTQRSEIATARRYQSEKIVQTGRITMKKIMASFTTASCVLLVAAGTAFARPPSAGAPQQNPTTGHKAGPTNTCPGTRGTPGNAGAATNPGSPFNGSPTTPGQAGNVYAGNPGTASLANSNSTAAVAQYDNACF